MRYRTNEDPDPRRAVLSDTSDAVRQHSTEGYAAALRMRSICLVVFLLLASVFVFRLLMRSAGRIEGMPTLTDKIDLRVQPPDRRP
jgi:hypothetical protein